MIHLFFRPASTKLFQASVPQTIPSYTDDYGPKPPTNRTEVSELSAQNRRNNPHPKEVIFFNFILTPKKRFAQEFFWWRLPAHFPPLIEGCALENTSSTELVNNLKKTVKPLSTYQQDYLKGACKPHVCVCVCATMCTSGSRITAGREPSSHICCY